MNKPVIPSILMAAGLLALMVTMDSHAADKIGKVTIKLPKEPTLFMQGPGLETVRNNCVKCHSADYIYMQPPFTKEQWLGEVTKMKKVYGAPIEDKDFDTIVNYLMSQNGKSN